MQKHNKTPHYLLPAAMFYAKIIKRQHDPRCKRHRDLLLLVGCPLAILTLDEQKTVGGHFFGAKNIIRTRREVDSLFGQLGCYQEWAY
ncbi:hypothetical protein ACHAW6_003113 [Cyclotella cf. meneghiniana]